MIIRLFRQLNVIVNILKNKEYYQQHKTKKNNLIKINNN